MHDSLLTEEQRMVRDMARDFARQELAPNADKWERDSWLDDAMLRNMGELGFLGMVVPEVWQGSLSDYTAYSLVVVKISACCASTAALMSSRIIVSFCPILNYGTQLKKEAWLPRLDSGEIIGCFVLTEPQAGSEANNLKTRAVLD